MSGDQIVRLCTDWLSQNYGAEIASKYSSYSLIIPMWNDPDLDDGLETLMQALAVAFGPDQSFGTTGYEDARKKLGLSEERIPIPEVFIEAFAGTCE